MGGAVRPSVAPAWLTARPIAHRGLHDVAHGVDAHGIEENTLAAARVAMDAGYGIECDVRRTRDGEALVFHDASLARLAGSSERVDALTMAQLGHVKLERSGATIPTFAQLLEAVDGRVPIICEIKSDFDGDCRVVDRVIEVAAAYAGPLAFMSFDPAIAGHLRSSNTARPLGIVSQARFHDTEWAALSSSARHALANFLHYEHTRPDFLAFRAADLPHAVPYLSRLALGTPILAWTVRSLEEALAAAHHSDQIVFEGFDPTGG